MDEHAFLGLLEKIIQHTLPDEFPMYQEYREDLLDYLESDVHNKHRNLDGAFDFGVGDALHGVQFLWVSLSIFLALRTFRKEQLSPSQRMVVEDWTEALMKNSKGKIPEELARRIASSFAADFERLAFGEGNDKNAPQ